MSRRSARFGGRNPFSPRDARSRRIQDVRNRRLRGTSEQGSRLGNTDIADAGGRAAGRDVQIQVAQAGLALTGRLT